MLYSTEAYIERINILLYDALLWELDTLHTNANLLMMDCIDYACEYSNYLNPNVQIVPKRYLGTYLHSRITTRLTK